MSAIQQALLTGSSSYIGPFDSYTANLYGAYGITKLLTAYSGSAIRVRRSSDNTEQDIGFSGLALNTSALSSFAGVGDAFITKWYDQSGNGNDLVQATTTKQPKTYSSGSYLGDIQFNLSSTDQFLKGPTNGGTSAAKTIFRRSAPRAFDSFNVDFEYGDSSLIGGASGANQIQLLQDAGGPYYQPFLATNASGTAYYSRRYARGSIGSSNNCFIIKKGQANATNSFAGYSNGSLLTDSGAPTSGTPVVTGNFPSYYWAIGARAAGTFGSRLSIRTCLIYDADKASDVAAISAILATL